MVSSPRPACEMNITPMIDVLLVLLVIFIAALPISQRGLDVSLPPDAPPPAVPSPASIVAEIAADRTIAINRQPIAPSELEGRLRAIYQSRRDRTLYVLGAASLRYDDVVSVIDAAKGAGVSRVGIITEGARLANQ